MAKEQHKGKFVGVYLSKDQYEKVKGIEGYLDRLLGGDANTSKALRFIIEHFDEEMVPSPPKKGIALAVSPN